MTREEAAKINPGDLVTVRVGRLESGGDVWVGGNTYVHRLDIISHEPAPPRDFQFGDVVRVEDYVGKFIIRGIFDGKAWVWRETRPYCTFPLTALTLIEAVEDRKP